MKSETENMGPNPKPGGTSKAKAEQKIALHSGRQNQRMQQNQPLQQGEPIQQKEVIQPKQEDKQSLSKKIGPASVFLWAVYALTVLLIILVVCDNLKS